MGGLRGGWVDIGRMGGWVGGWMGGYMNEWVGGWVDMSEWVGGYMSGWMSTCRWIWVCGPGANCIHTLESLRLLQIVFSACS